MGFLEQLPTVIWYTAEFLCYLAIIAFTLFTFKIIGPPKFKNEVPATFDQTWKDTNQIINVGASFLTKVQNAMNKSEDDKGDNSNVKEIKKE